MGAEPGSRHQRKVRRQLFEFDGGSELAEDGGHRVIHCPAHAYTMAQYLHVCVRTGGRRGTRALDPFLAREVLGAQPSIVRPER